MQKLVVSILLLLSLHVDAQSHLTYFEQTKGAGSPVYNDIVSWWQKLDAASPLVQIKTMGSTDAGLPLHLVLISADKDFSPSSIKAKGKTIILVNNGIHPGEPDGIDASMLLARDMVQGKYKLPANVVLAIIPVYNIGGALNRSPNYRIDQNGPTEKGFRGNAQNLDLNRDFIKMDSKNAFAFAQIFHFLDPDIFIDNHVSNGADYQHVMTLLTSQHNKLGGESGKYLNEVFEPALYGSMKTKGYDLVPYVNHFGETPDNGWSQYWDGPRYSSGYATLWNSFAFVPETHMLKPYAQRVDATRKLMESFIEFAAANGQKIISLRREARAQQLQQTHFPIAWKWNAKRSTEIEFKGYTAGKKQSVISGQQRLYYDRNAPFTKKVPFYNIYDDSIRIAKPKAYLIPQGWWKVIERLQANGVTMQRLQRDTILEVEAYRIETYQSGARPYEGHHPNRDVQVSKTVKRLFFRKGDYRIDLNQKANRFLMETLEPQAEDSYFAWNFFDPILGQKEGFSDYVFEETAEAFLKVNPGVQQKLEERRAKDSSFAKNGRAQLNFVYQNSPYYEPAHLQYPVYRLVN